MNEYKWHFPKTEGGVEQGFEDSSMAYFKSDPHRYIARETIQNALDARDESKKEPVVVEFKLFKADIKKAIPDLSRYKAILEDNRIANNNNPNARKFFKRAINICNHQSINILSISDSNTVGVKDINKDKGRWHGLIKMVGKGSQEQRNMGGTFGIGKAAPFVCSELRTVLYNTINAQDKSAFIWKSIFTTHGSPKRQGSGFFCDYSINSDEETIANGISNNKLRPSFADRNYHGTDLFILGFKKPVSNRNHSWHVLFKRVILNNYFVALYDNELRVIMKDEAEGKDYEINSSNVLEFMEQNYSFHRLDKTIKTNFPFIDAYANTKNNIVKDLFIEGLGKCKLYLILKKDYPRKVAYMRLPKMLVYQKGNTRLKTGYAALFICDSRKGNRFLSRCEDPTHQVWNSGWHPKKEKASRVLARISREVNAVLTSLMTETYDEETILSGLDQFTFDESDSPMDSEGNNLEADGDGEDGFLLDELIIESHDLDYVIPNPIKKKKRKKKIKEEDGSGMGEGERSGTGGSGEKGGSGGTQSGEKGFGDAEGGKGKNAFKKIPKTRYSYKCFQKSGQTNYNLVISTKFEDKCQIRLFSQAIDTKRNESINIVKAVDLNTGLILETNKNLISSIETNSNPKTIEITIEENRKFGVEVELYA